MRYYKLIDDFITEEERAYLLSLANADDFVQHKSTVSDELSPLMFKPVKFRNFPRASIMKMLPKTIQGMHVDGSNLRRNTLIIHPLTDNYAPIITQAGEVHQTAIINTQEPHAVFNNDNVRVNLQLPFDVDFKDLENIMGEVVELYQT